MLSGVARSPGPHVPGASCFYCVLEICAYSELHLESFQSLLARLKAKHGEGFQSAEEEWGENPEHWVGLQ